MPLPGFVLALQIQATVLPSLPEASPASVVAIRAEQPPVLDGRDDDPLWASVPIISGFRESSPAEGGSARFPTRAQLAYDAHHLYIFVRALDPHPDSIVGLLSRRDVVTASDQVIVMVDPYHDRRTGYEFMVNPAGVKVDYALANDGNEDVAWDGVWDVATRVDSLGWTAEYSIPLSQLHYRTSGEGTFGITVWRRIERYAEVLTWPLHRASRAGLVSQFGELQGLNGLASRHRSELTPYLVAKNRSRPTGSGFDRHQDLTVGGDLKYPLASNLTLSATINPDFGQVEADPAELNLSPFESFFSERRPFFVEGSGLFHFSVNCSAANGCDSGEGLFYPRRIGRAPQLSGRYGDPSSAASTTIIGAGKLTGRFPGGLAVGLLGAVTPRVAGAGQATIEPATRYGALRVVQDYGGGKGSIGVMATGVNRSLDQWSDSLLRRNAYAVGLDFRHRMLGNRFEVSGAFDVSRVTGDRRAIAATQLDPVHLYQRPDGALRFDSTRTSLAGDAEEIRFTKIGGDPLYFELDYLRRSPGFELNDLGFLRQTGQQSWSLWTALHFMHPNRVFRSLQWNLKSWLYLTTAGMATEREASTNVHMQFSNRWWLHLGGDLGKLGSPLCDRCARGGPAVRQDLYLAPWIGIAGDDRKTLVPSIWVYYYRFDGGRSTPVNLNPQVDLKASSRLSTSLSLNWTRNRNDTQWFANFTDTAGTAHYTFAHLDQTEVGVTWRLDYAFSPGASLQVYAQPFVSKGTYSNVRELNLPRAARYDDRYRAYADTAVTNHPGGFNVKDFRSNVVFRWEYRRGSALFLVWNQGRHGQDPSQGNRGFLGDVRDLFGLHAGDTFLVKLSYWLDW